ncbi:MAG: hypothetical protein JWN66_2046 [Sphingomonas bacterium]|jgi:hypothetical protein|uniref:hypothetical protein n=1 Tax=Sphingomonas bacterium TaxID=1895847 RepID=UPI002629A67A|nr:hypothetical protein [Sphingomonas bacterium]MDB5704930.1 hypothetical protein [Sphingomonas bacterium]
MIDIFALMFLPGVAPLQQAAPRPTRAETIRDEVCGRGDRSRPPQMSDRPADAGDDIVVIASRTNHNSLGQSLLVNCTEYEVKSVRVSPDDGHRPGRGREIFDPNYLVRLPGDKEPYPVLDFNYHQVQRARPDDSMFSNHQRIGPRVCKYLARVTVTKARKQSQTLELYFDTCHAFVLTVKNVVPDDTGASDAQSEAQGRR